jgi:hypothetical protein
VLVESLNSLSIKGIGLIIFRKYGLFPFKKTVVANPVIYTRKYFILFPFELIKMYYLSCNINEIT